MILNQKLRYLVLVVILLWMIILIKYIGQRPLLLPERPPKLLPINNNNNNNFMDAIVPQRERQLHHLQSTVPSRKKELVDRPAPPLNRPEMVPSVNLSTEDEMSEVSYNNGEKARSSTPRRADPVHVPENERQKRVVDAFLHAWKAYKRYAWGYDELKPLSKSGNNWLDVGLTIVDSLDTMIIMKLDEEFQEAKEWIAVHLTTSRNKNRMASVQFFEIVIRLLGGLLSAFHLSKEEIFRQKAEEFGKMLMPCFDGPNGIPCHRVFVADRRPSFENTNLAEIGTVQLEFRDLGRVTGNEEFETKAFRVSELLHQQKKFDGLLPSLFVGGLNFPESQVSMGGQSDSYYEYLLKQWLQTGKTIDWLKEDYEAAIMGAQKHLMKRSRKGNLLYLGSVVRDYDSTSFTPSMEHLSCFLPGTLALGHLNGMPSSHLELAKELMRTCYSMYSESPLHLAPEVVNFAGVGENHERPFYVDTNSAYNIHRPETVESLFYLHRATGDPIYKEWAWKIFEAFEKHTRLEQGYAGIQDVSVTASRTTFLDKMETFYLAETLKYLYLLFGDRTDVLPLNEWVFNTEAHPLPIRQN